VGYNGKAHSVGTDDIATSEKNREKIAIDLAVILPIWDRE